jgi:hypothetical protein
LNLAGLAAGFQGFALDHFEFASDSFVQIRPHMLGAASGLYEIVFAVLWGEEARDFD